MLLIIAIFQKQNNPPFMEFLNITFTLISAGICFYFFIFGFNIHKKNLQFFGIYCTGLFSDTAQKWQKQNKSNKFYHLKKVKYLRQSHKKMVMETPF